MRLLMTADAVGGIWTHALDLARGLRAHEVEVVLAVLGPAPSESQRADARRAGVAALHELGGSLEWMDEPWEDLERAGERLLGLAGDGAVDAVHLNSYAPGALVWRQPVVVAGHSCVCSWWLAVEGEEAPPRWDRYREAVRRGLAGADAVVAPTRAMLRALERSYGVRGGCVIHNGCSAPDLAAAAKEPVVAAAGRAWDRAKNLELLERAAPGLPWPVLVADGRMPYGEVQALFARAAILAHPARYEPFGLAPLEAARAGCVLVLGDIEPLRELWGDAALYADPSDEEALRAAIAGLIEDERLRAEMARRARGRARRYTLARMGAAYARLYERVAERVGAAA